MSTAKPHSYAVQPTADGSVIVFETYADGCEFVLAHIDLWDADYAATINLALALAREANRHRPSFKGVEVEATR
jgi:hypothetical protein